IGLLAPRNTKTSTCTPADRRKSAWRLMKLVVRGRSGVGHSLVTIRTRRGAGVAPRSVSEVVMGAGRRGSAGEGDIRRVARSAPDPQHVDRKATQEADAVGDVDHGKHAGKDEGAGKSVLGDGARCRSQGGREIAGD